MIFICAVLVGCLVYIWTYYTVSINRSLNDIKRILEARKIEEKE